MDAMSEKKEKAIKMVTRLMEIILAEGDEGSDALEKEANDLVYELKKIVPDRNCSDYIFWSDEFYREDGTFDVEGLVDKCFEKQNVIAL